MSPTRKAESACYQTQAGQTLNVTTTEKKTKELGSLLAFQKNCADCPQFKPIQADPPAPDITFSDGEIGIELTEYSLGQGQRGSPFRRLEVVRDRVAIAAQALYEKFIHHCLQVSILWSTLQCPTKQEEQQISSAIAELVRMHPFIGTRMHRIEWRQFRSPLLKKYIDTVSFFFIAETGQSCWSSAVGLAFPREASRIQVAINAKESKVSEYRKASKKIWLLITADRNYFSSQFTAEVGLDQVEFQTSFDRVFLIDEPQNLVYEFRTVPKESVET
jgi:hypothetical protein